MEILFIWVLWVLSFLSKFSMGSHREFQQVTLDVLSFGYNSVLVLTAVMVFLFWAFQRFGKWHQRTSHKALKYLQWSRCLLQLRYVGRPVSSCFSSCFVLYGQICLHQIWVTLCSITSGFTLSLEFIPTQTTSCTWVCLCSPGRFRKSFIGGANKPKIKF